MVSATTESTPETWLHDQAFKEVNPESLKPTLSQCDAFLFKNVFTSEGNNFQPDTFLVINLQSRASRKDVYSYANSSFITSFLFYMGLHVTKPVFRISHTILDMILSNTRITKVLIRLHRWTGCYAPFFVCKLPFSQVEAVMLLIIHVN